MSKSFRRCSFLISLFSLPDSVYYGSPASGMDQTKTESVEKNIIDNNRDDIERI